MSKTIWSFLSACCQNYRMLLSACPHEMSINGVQFSIPEPVVLSEDMQMGPEKSFSVSYKFHSVFTRYSPLKNILVEYSGDLGAEKRTSVLMKKALPPYMNVPNELLIMSK